jgi:hypothetical protein
MEMRVELESAWEEAEQQLKVLRPLIERYVSWEEEPPLKEAGRTAWVTLKDPVVIMTSMGEVPILSLKFKGIGLRDHLGNIFKPCAKGFYRTQKHVGFSNSGELVTLESMPSPLGGILLERARAEFEIAKKLVAGGCSCQLPLLLYRYAEDGLVFALNGAINQPLGVVVSGFSTGTLLRGNAVINYDILKGSPRTTLDQWADSLEVSSGGDRAIAMLTKLLSQYACALRRFHELGFYRYSGGLSNFSYSEAIRDIFLIDLDSSGNLSECPETIRSLQTMRDIVSIYFHLTGRMLRVECFERFPPQRLWEPSPFLAILSGYFPELSKSVLRKAAEKLHETYGGMYQLAFYRHQERQSVASFHREEELSFQEYRDFKNDKYWLDMKKVFCVGLEILWDLHDRSNLSSVIPHLISKSDFLRNVSFYSSMVNL